MFRAMNTIAGGITILWAQDDRPTHILDDTVNNMHKMDSRKIKNNSNEPNCDDLDS